MSSLGGIGSTQQQWPPYTPPYSQVDSDASGGLSLDELEAATPQGSSSTGSTSQAAQSQFSAIDSNGDGSISSDEFSAFQTQAQAFATQLIASGQQPPDGAAPGDAAAPGGADGSPSSAGGHVHGGHHHHGSGGSSTSATSSTGDSLLQTLEGIVDGSPTSDSSTDADTDQPSGLFGSAISAYTSAGAAGGAPPSLTDLLAA